MAHVYIVTPEDIEKLLLRIDRDPKHSMLGGGSDVSVRDPEKERIYDEAHRFYNYQVRTWIAEVTK